MKQNARQYGIKSFSGFDYFVFAGGAINFIVVVYLFCYWLLFG